jgi:F-type H+-transporting ATPase subunit epsilon
MTAFSLKIVTPDGLAFDGQAEELIVRTTSGDLGIMAGHIACVAPLGMGRATVIAEGKRRYAACIGGMVSVMKDHVSLVPTTFEWAEDIDAERVAASERRARDVLKEKTSTATDIRLAEARLKRALVRKSIVQE